MRKCIERTEYAEQHVTEYLLFPSRFGKFVVNASFNLQGQLRHTARADGTTTPSLLVCQDEEGALVVPDSLRASYNVHLSSWLGFSFA